MSLGSYNQGVVAAVEAEIEGMYAELSTRLDPYSSSLTTAGSGALAIAFAAGTLLLPAEVTLLGAVTAAMALSAGCTAIGLAGVRILDGVRNYSSSAALEKSDELALALVENPYGLVFGVTAEMLKAKDFGLSEAAEWGKLVSSLMSLQSGVRSALKKEDEAALELIEGAYGLLQLDFEKLSLSHEVKRSEMPVQDTPATDEYAIKIKAEQEAKQRLENRRRLEQRIRSNIQEAVDAAEKQRARLEFEERERITRLAEEQRMLERIRKDRQDQLTEKGKLEVEAREGMQKSMEEEKKLQELAKAEQDAKRKEEAEREARRATREREAAGERSRAAEEDRREAEREYQAKLAHEQDRQRAHAYSGGTRYSFSESSVSDTPAYTPIRMP